jgi:ribosome recycling factor
MAATKQQLTERMEAAIEHFKKEMAGMRTGRASVALIDAVKVDYYGTPTPLKQVANLSVPEPRMITVQPWEPSMIKDIEKAILTAGLGLNPANDGKLIRIPIPPLTEERRKELSKVCKKYAEETKVALRNIRRDSNEEQKKLQKDGKLSEDELRRSEADIQKLTDQYVQKVDQVLAAKEKEIMEV